MIYVEKKNHFHSSAITRYYSTPTRRHCNDIKILLLLSLENDLRRYILFKKSITITWIQRQVILWNLARLDFKQDIHLFVEMLLYHGNL